jgi:hypothetical protein
MPEYRCAPAQEVHEFGEGQPDAYIIRDTGAAHGKELSLRSRESPVLQAIYFPYIHQISAKLALTHGRT